MTYSFSREERTMTWRSLGMALMLGAATVASTGCTTLNMRPLPIASKNPDADPIAAKVAFARLCERHGQSEQARQTYQSLLKQDPRMQVPLHRLAVMAAKQGKFDEADMYFEKALSTGAPNAELLSDHGYCLYLEDRLDEAEKALRDATTLDPRYKAAKVNLGLVLGQQERFNDSYAAFKDAIGESQALANMAYVQAQRNDFDQAEALYSRALSNDPEMRSAALALVQLNDVKKRQQMESSVQQAKATEPIAARPPKSTIAEEEFVDARRTRSMANATARSTSRQEDSRSTPIAMISDSVKNRGPSQRPSAPLAQPSETASGDFVSRQRFNKNWGASETQQNSPVNVSVAGLPRQTESAAEPIRGEAESKSASTSLPIQVTTRQAEKGTKDDTAKATVTTPSPGAAQTQLSIVSSAPTAQSASTNPNPQVLDMTKVRDNAVSKRAGENESQRTLEPKSPPSPAPKAMAATKNVATSRTMTPSQQRAPLTPPTPPVPPSRKPAKSTEITPVSTQASTAMISDRPAASRILKPTTSWGANAPARLDSTNRYPSQPSSPDAQNKTPEGKDADMPARALKPTNNGLSQQPAMQSESSSVRYVDYRDTLPATLGAAKVQPAAASDQLDCPAQPSVVPSEYPSTSNPSSFVPTAPAFQGARMLTPQSQSIPLGIRSDSAQAPAGLIDLPGYADASDSQ